VSNLQLTFQDVYTKVSEFLGTGSSPSGTSLTNAKNVVHRGYRKFLFPIDMRTGKQHTWSFLIKQAVLNTKDGEWVYDLPADFKRLAGPFRHEKDSGYPEMVHTTIERIWQMRAGVESTNYPHFYAIKSAPYVKEIGTAYQVVFFETPNNNYRLNYSYVFRPPKLENDDDVFVGGDEASEAILECCLAIAEVEYDDTIGIHNQMADRLVQQLIQDDTPLIADSVGKNYDPAVRYISYQRPLPTIETDEIYPNS